MQIHRLAQPGQTLFPPNHSMYNFYPSSLLRHPTRLVFTQRPKSGFCNSIKRVPKSMTSLRKFGSSVGIYCSVVQNDDEFYMRRCVELAKKAIGCTSPNPMVGSVIVKDGKIVGEGFHPKAGQPHAEVFALREAGNSAENATAYVSLEPCNHYGKTPPCTEALIKAKVKRVVVGMVDPNPIVDSKGVERLRDAGIDVTVGVEEELCKKLNEAFIHKVLTGKPFVTLRYSLSVNGHLLDKLGEGVTNSGGYYSKLLQEYDAVIFSASLIEEFGLPASQEPGAKQPLQIITASNPNSLIHICGLFENTSPKLLVITDKEIYVELETAKRGIETVVMDHISLNEILEYCKRQGFCSVLIDLRGNYGDLKMLLTEGIEENPLQKIVVEVLPMWGNGEGGKLFAMLNRFGKNLKMRNLQPEISNESIVIEGYF